VWTECIANCIQVRTSDTGCEFLVFLSVASLHTQHISSSSFLLPVYIPNTSVPVPSFCRSTYPTHQFQFLSYAGLQTQHISSSSFLLPVYIPNTSVSPVLYLAPHLCKMLRTFDTLGIETWGLSHVNILSPC
jgi:hypothetical protein